MGFFGMAMDHSHGDHSHAGHGDMDMGDQCAMNMLFTWDTKNLCIIFHSWRVTGPISLLLSLLAIIILTAGYECVREISRRYEQKHSAQMSALGGNGSTDDARLHESSSLLSLGRDSKNANERDGTIVKAAFYAIQVFYSFFIMLLFMTYNGWVMAAVAVGAFVGYLMFGKNVSSTKTVACH